MTSAGVGVAYSGGGITGVLASMCAHHTLESLGLPGFANATFSTASGGTLGFLIHQSTAAAAAPRRPVDWPPPLSARLTLEQMRSSAVPRGHSWWAAASRYIPNATEARNGGPGWWQDVMSTAFLLGYGVRDADVTVGAARMLAINVAVVRASGCPLARNASTGVARDAASAIRHAAVEASAGVPLRVRVAGGPQLARSSTRNLSLVVGAAWSTAFWAAPLVESRLAYLAELAAERAGVGLLLRAEAVQPPSTRTEEVYLLDGGVVDTTGIVALLQRGSRRILASYNNNDALAPPPRPQSESASLAYLFGVAERTDAMNSLPGPALLQVFPSALYAAALANLTDPSRGTARLSSVPVLRNDYLGVAAGRLDELLVVSNGRSDAFLQSFADRRIAQAVSPAWPDRMPTGVPPLEANLLCELQRWKLAGRHRAAVRELFRAGEED